ncbi:unnamed protein product [Symbiodinium sp. CCMP2592]|nr:unnamed protein product [Symbiodinium sp. CCMP2592]
MHKTSVALRRVLELLAVVVLAVIAADCVDHEAESVGCSEVNFIQSARALFRNPEPAAEEQKAHFESFREAMMRASRNRKELKELRWRFLRTFPAIPMEREQQENPNPGCSNIGTRFPTLVSRNQSLLDAYARYACGDGRDYFVTDPARSLSAELAPLDNGCINMPLSSLRFVRGTALKATESPAEWSVTLGCCLSGAAEANALEDDQVDVRLERQLWPVPAQAAIMAGDCPESCQQENFWHQLPTQVVDQDMLVLPTIREPPQMGYQHSLIDFLPQAWTVLELLRNSSTKLVVHTSLQSQLLASLGFPREQILEVPLTDERPAVLLCAKSGRTLHLWRVGSGDSEPLPNHPYQDGRADGDLWHRLIDIQVGPEISNAVAEYNGFVAEPFAPRLVLFLQRCTDHRTLENEQAALAAISSALIKSNRTEELVSMCAGREDFLEQVWKVRQARLIVGAHGGAMANMVLARPDAGIIEVVGDAAAEKGFEGLWPPYKRSLTAHTFREATSTADLGPPSPSTEWFSTRPTNTAGCGFAWTTCRQLSPTS